MKNKLLVITLSALLAILLILPSLSVAAADGKDTVLLGDADQDGYVSILDATRIQRVLAHLSEFEGDGELAADVDGNGVIEILDATYIQQWLAELDVPYAIGEEIDVTDPTEATEETEAAEATEESESTEATQSTESTEATEASETTEVTGDEWKENTGVITLSDSGITVTGTGAYVDGNTVIITEGGDWEVVGSCSDGMIYVNTGEEKDVNDKVKLRLNGMSLTNPDGPAIYFDRCKKAFITIESGTENTVTDGASFTTTVEEHTIDGATYSIDASAAKGAIHSDDTLEIKGKGSLTVNGNYKHGICSDDDILIENGVFDITSVKDAFHANDDITLNGKNIEVTVNATSDGFDSEGTLNMTLVKSVKITADGKGIKADGDIVIDAGTYTVDTADDCINGNTAVTINGGTFSLESDDEAITAVTTLTIGGADMTISCVGKGVKSDEDLIINSGTFVINSTDDSIHCNANVTINGGTFTLTSGDDGIHADTTLTIEDGTLTITKSYEGLEGNDVIINGGTISIKASDDGINAAGGNDQSSQGGRPGQNNFQPGTASNSSITVNDGYVYVAASGDGIDSNGALSFNGGTVIVQGPSSGGNSPVDADGTVGFNGGTVMAIASSNAMWEDLNGKLGNAVMNKSIGSVSSGSVIAVTDSSGNVLSVLKPTLSGNLGVVYYTDRSSSLTSCKVVTGGNYSGTLDSFGYAESGTISGGTGATLSASSGGSQPGGPGGRW